MGKAETIRDGPFYDRVMRWREDKEKTASVKKQQVDRSSMQVAQNSIRFDLADLPRHPHHLHLLPLAVLTLTLLC